MLCLFFLLFIISRQYDVATHGLDAGELGAAHTALQKAGLADEEWTFENDGYGVLTVRNRWAERNEPDATELPSIAPWAHCGRSLLRQSCGTSGRRRSALNVMIWKIS